MNINSSFSIIIPTWNNLPYLEKCVRSIKKNSTFNHEIILHINEGNDGSLDFARDMGLTYTHSNENIGICHAVNSASNLSTKEWLVYMNDDMYVLPGWDIELIRSMPQDTDLFMLSGTMIEPTETGNDCVIVADHGKSHETFDESSLLSSFLKYHHNDWNGSSWPPTLVHIRWWRAAGGYSVELFPGMSSDTDFAMKMWMLGCRIFKGVERSRIYHFQCKSTGRIIKNNGANQFLSKWGISQSDFNRLYLKRGSIYNGKLNEPEESKLFYAKLKATLKRRFGSIFTPYY